MENKFKGYYWDKEGKQPASEDELKAKIKEAGDPFITLKLSDLIDKNKLMKKLEVCNGKITFYGKFEPEQ